MLEPLLSEVGCSETSWWSLLWALRRDRCWRAGKGWFQDRAEKETGRGPGGRAAQQAHSLECPDSPRCEPHSLNRIPCSFPCPLCSCRPLLPARRAQVASARGQQDFWAGTTGLKPSATSS